MLALTLTDFAHYGPVLAGLARRVLLSQDVCSSVATHLGRLITCGVLTQLSGDTRIPCGETD